jgi:hypothetical protein
MSDAPKELFNLLFKIAQAAYKAGGFEEAYKDFVDSRIRKDRADYYEKQKQSYYADEAARYANKKTHWRQNRKFYEIWEDLNGLVEDAARGFWKSKKRIDNELGEPLKLLKTRYKLLVAEQLSFPLLEPDIAIEFYNKIEKRIAALDKKLASIRAKAIFTCQTYILRASGDEFDLGGIEELFQRAEQKADKQNEYLGNYIPNLRGLMSKLERELDKLRLDLKATNNTIALTGFDPKRSIVSQFRLDVSLSGADFKTLGTMLDSEWTQSDEALFIHIDAVDWQNSLASNERTDFLLTLFERLVLNCALRQMALAAATAFVSPSDKRPTRLDAPIITRGKELLKTLNKEVRLTNTKQLDRLVDAMVLASQCDFPPLVEEKLFKFIKIDQLPPVFATAGDQRHKHYCLQLERLDTVLTPLIGKEAKSARSMEYSRWQLELLRKLHRELGMEKPSSALAAWDFYVGEKQAARDKLEELISPIFWCIIADILDHPFFSDRGEIVNDHETFLEVRNLDALARAVLAQELKTMLASTDIFILSMATRVDIYTRLTFFRGAESLHRFTRLIQVLQMSDVDRANYFTDAAKVPEVGGFSDLVAKIGKDRFYFSQGEFGAALTTSQFDEAQRILDAWMRVAPDIDLTSKLREFDITQSSITNWSLLERYLAFPGTAAIGLDFSNHVSTDIMDSGQSIPFEVNRYSRNALPDGALSVKMLQAHAQGECPWRGEFTDVDTGGDIIGLSSLIVALNNHEKQKKDPMPRDARDHHNALSALAEAQIYLNVQRIVDRELKARRFSRAMPIIVGTHDFGVFPSVVYTTTSATNP